MILGHSRQIEYLDKVLKRGRMSHAYLFYGPARVGKFTVAKSFARALCCLNYRGEASNGGFASIVGSSDDCKNCQLIEKNAHPQVMILDTEHTFISKKEIRKDIPIEDIRELKRRLSYVSVEDKWRIVIINEAQKLSDEASNAFLKLLEEPGEKALFLLIAESPELLPSTIVSRTQPIRFSLVSDGVIEQHLKSSIKNESERKEILFFASGRPGVAVELAENKDLLEKERKFRKMFHSAVSGEFHDVFDFTGKIHGDVTLRTKTAEYLIWHMREKMLKNIDGEKSLTNRIKRVHEIHTILDTTNVNPRLALDVMLLEGIRND